MGRASEAKEVMMMTPEREETLERARRAIDLKSESAPRAFPQAAQKPALEKESRKASPLVSHSKQVIARVAKTVGTHT